jgi:hypothetical protein
MHAPVLLLRPSCLSLCLAAALGLSLPTLHAAPSSADGVSAKYQRQLDLRRQRSTGVIDAPRTPAPIGVAAVRLVTSCADDGSPGTLRSQVLAAGENDTIDMSALTCSTITLIGGEIDISVLGDHQINNLTLVGPGRDRLIIDANNARFLNHGDFQIGLGQLVLRDFSITNGNYTHGLASCLDSSGDVTLTRVTISDCHASNGGPLTFGGAVSVSGDLAMIDSAITGSSSSAGGDNVAIGGGAYVSGNLSLVDSTISGNTASSVIGDDGPTYITAGGGVYVRGELDATRSTISGNQVNATGSNEQATGAGVFVRARAELVDSTIDSNTADGTGGGLAKAVFSVYGDPGTTLTVRNTTISGNTAARGAGLSSARPLTLSNSTVTANAASEGGAGVFFAQDSTANPTFTLQSSIVAANVAGGSATWPADLAASGPLTVAGADNLIIEAGTLPLPADTLDADPQLAPLAANGGPTRTHALLPASPARDAGNNAAALGFDQRGSGHPRVVGASADIGAFEWRSDGIFRDGFDAPFTYLRDDGAASTNMGPPSSFDPDMLWGNYYTVQPGGEFITTLSVAFGPTFPSLANGPVTFWLLADPDADGDPRNATLLVSTQATPDVTGNTFFNVTIPPTRVSGAFFVGASAKLDGGVDRPARVDGSNPGDNSWFFYAPDIAAVINNLASAPFGSQNVAPTNPLPGAFLVRASAVGP